MGFSLQCSFVKRKKSEERQVEAPLLLAASGEGCEKACAGIFKQSMGARNREEE